MMTSFRHWRKEGEHWIWLSSAAIAASLIMVIGLLALIAVRGLGFFWPANIHEIHYTTPSGIAVVAGEYIENELVQDDTLGKHKQSLYKIGNREHFGLDFRWINATDIIQQKDGMPYWVIERIEWGNAYGLLNHYTWKGKQYSADDSRLLQKFMKEVRKISNAINQIERYDMGAINHEIEKLRRNKKKLEHKRAFDTAAQTQHIASNAALDERYNRLRLSLDKQYEELNALGELHLSRSDGSTFNIPFKNIVHLHQPNQMNVLEKIAHYFSKIWEFVSTEPREANTEGGIFPAIFGTVSLVFLMTILVTPFGVIAAVYLREYAKQGLVVRIIRISVNNLAGVPSIVYGVFGLGFFVYFLGGNIDELFYSHALPSPTFGSPGLLWASLTLALLTLPVVIVSTEEGLSRVPSAIREGSLALGATHFETLMRTVLPMTSPAIMTGLILAIARAAGEVAPLMLVGVVKLAPDLAIDSVAPYLHLDRQFMHLGFHIYDVGFQSPNVEAARPLVYATAFLLVVIILLLNLIAIRIRNRLREKYKSLEY